MYRYNRILVTLSLCEADESMIRYAAKISHMASSEKVCFAHVAETQDLPEEVRSLHEDLMPPSREGALIRMKKMVETHFDGNPDAELLYEASEGSPLKDILRDVRDMDIDLILVEKECGIPHLPAKLARKAPCSVMMVPTGFEPKLGKIMVATDFSDNAEDAMDKAAVFAKAAGEKEIHALHIYSVPLGYQKTGKTYEEFASILKEHAEKAYRKFTKKIDLKGIRAPLITELNEKPYQGIHEIADKLGVDLLVVGARGRTSAAAVLLGSVTERLLEVCRMPLLAVKKKGENLSFLDALLDM